MTQGANAGTTYQVQASIVARPVGRESVLTVVGAGPGLGCVGRGPRPLPFEAALNRSDQSPARCIGRECSESESTFGLFKPARTTARVRPVLSNRSEAQLSDPKS